MPQALRLDLALLALAREFSAHGGSFRACGLGGRLSSALQRLCIFDAFLRRTGALGILQRDPFALGIERRRGCLAGFTP